MFEVSKICQTSELLVTDENCYCYQKILKFGWWDKNAVTLKVIAMKKEFLFRLNMKTNHF